MSIFKCKICGGTLEITSGETVAICEYCGTKQTLPKLDDEKKANLFDRANHFRRNNDFDKAMGIYEQILNEDTEDAESYWSIVLCRYGIEYVEDPSSRKRVPTVNRAQFTSVFDDEDYKSAIKYADAHQKELYEKEATAINEIQKGILAISGQEEPFDVFICYKETDANGRRTQDSVLATELYHELTREGYKVFFSRITLEDKLGTAYEPYIFAALNSSKVMVVLGTRPEHFNAVWVKNEWSRYLALIKQGQKKMLIPAFRDMDPYDLPEEFSHLQAQDMSKLGFMQDLVRGITKLVSLDTASAVKETVVVQSSVSGNASALVKRGFLALEDGDWNKADEFFEQALNQDAEDAQAYLGKLMAELQVKTRSALKNCKQPFDNSTNYQKAIRFADSSLSSELKECISFIKDRNAKKAKEEYNDSIYLRALEEYQSSDIGKLNDAIELFSEIADWKDSKELIGKCQVKIEQIRVQEENERIERERLAEEKRLEDERQKELKRIAREKAKKRNKKLAIIITPIITLIVAFVVVFNVVIIPNSKYNTAVALMNDGKYTEAIYAFELLDGYKDSKSKIEECNVGILNQKYYKAISLMEDGKYEDALAIFNEIKEQRECNDKIEECNSAILEIKYNAAIELISLGQYEDALKAFKTFNGYKESAQKIEECNAGIIESTYNNALTLMGECKYEEAKKEFESLKGYKDSENHIKNCVSNLIVEVRVSTVQELIDNIGNYKKIILTSSYYNLSDVNIINNQNVKKAGYNNSLTITGVEYLTITGDASIVINDRYADVLRFEKCKNLELSGVTVGHVEINDEYMCDGSVVRIERCDTVKFEKCNFFGCGAIGVDSWGNKNVTIKDSNIYECNFSGISASDSQIIIENTDFYDFVLDDYGGLVISTNSQMDFKNCSFKNAKSNVLISVDEYSGLSRLNFSNCTISNNTYNTLTTSEKKTIFTNCTITNNR